MRSVSIDSVLRVVAWAHARVATRGRERGDLIGWVLITVMTAGLVAVLWATLGPQLESLLSAAIRRAIAAMP